MNNLAAKGRSNIAVILLIVVVGIAFLTALSMPMLGLMRWVPGSGLFGFRHFGFPMLPIGLMSVIQIVLAIWVGIDAQRKGQNGVLWGLLVLFTSVIGLIVYLLVSPMVSSRSLGAARNGPTAPPPPPGAVCPSCHAQVQSDFRVCPHCGASLARCRQCDRPIRSDWKVCPYCGAALQG
jgi:RNA polymerase subunit RPABC4/transcription elongation factor Spt4